MTTALPSSWFRVAGWAGGVVGAVLAALVVGLASGQERPQGPDHPRPRDVLVITVDTARADRYSYAGPSPVKTSVADALAERGAAFVCAVAPSPITLVSHASLFTGQDPPEHGVRNNGEFALAPEAITLAEVLAEHGWATAAFIGAAVLDARYGLDQGFASYDDDIDGTDQLGMFSYARRRGGEVVDAALSWLRGRPPGPTFVWVHLYDPHAPYLPPEPERSRYKDSPYDGTIAYTDRIVGELLDGYRALGRAEHTLVVLTSDHGESLGEHGEDTHGVFVYDATVRIPLVIAGPGVAPGSRVTAPVRLIDLMPTVLALVGIAVPNTVTGSDLGPALRGGRIGSPRPAYVESELPWLSYGWSALHGLRTERWKYVEGTGPELYDLQADPGELVDVVGQHPEVVHQLALELAARLEGSGTTTALSVEVDDATRARLAALGYVSIDDAGTAGRGGGPLPDPRQRIRAMQRMYAAMTRFAQGDTRAGIAGVEAVVTDEPENLTAVATLGQLRYRVGDYAGAARAFAGAARIAPDEAKYHEYEGLAHERAGQLEQALAAQDRALAVEPSRQSARSLRWRLLSRLGRRDELVEDLEQTLALEPDNGMARVMHARLTLGDEPTDRLIATLEAAHLELPDDPAVASALAHAVLARGDEARAERLYRVVLEHVPGDHDASLVAGSLTLARGEDAEARRILEAGVRKHPDRPAMQVGVARARIATGDLIGARQALTAALRLDDGAPDAWLAAAQLSLAEGHPERAEGELERARELGADDASLWRRIADAYRTLGRETDAARAAARSTGR